MPTIDPRVKRTPVLAVAVRVEGEEVLQVQVMAVQALTAATRSPANRFRAVAKNQTASMARTNLIIHR